LTTVAQDYLVWVVQEELAHCDVGTGS